MSQLISFETVKTKIDSAENTFQECFEMLLDLKHARDNMDDVLTMFQPKLAESLYELMQFYQELHCEKSRMIASKSQYDKEAFVKIMRKNARFTKLVSDAIELGKSLGDAFAWFFFRDNRSELDKHFEHETTGLYVGGIGGLGELEFIKHSGSIDGLYVLYHGITTMLRIGDFSLYDLNLGIVGVGELKTKVVDDSLQVTANITSKVNIALPADATKSNFGERMRELQKDFPKLKKQMELHPELLHPAESERSSKLYASYEYELLDKLSSDNPVVINGDKSLLLFATWSRGKTLFDVLSDKEMTDDIPKDFAEKVSHLMEPASPYNEMVLGQLETKMCLLRIPIFWWHIDDDVCRNIYFGRMTVVTVFNPAKLLQCFVDDGFTVERMGPLTEINVFKIDGNHRIRIGHFESICDLINHSLMKTENVYAFSRKVTVALERGEFQPGSKIDMHIHQNSFGEKNI